MKILKIVTLISLFTSTAAWAALSPYYDSIEKLQTVLSAYPASETSAPISNVRAEDVLTYQVTAGDCTVTVTLEAQPPSMPGKTTYKVKSISQPICE